MIMKVQSNIVIMLFRIIKSSTPTHTHHMLKHQYLPPLQLKCQLHNTHTHTHLLVCKHSMCDKTVSSMCMGTEVLCTCKFWAYTVHTMLKQLVRRKMNQLHESVAVLLLLTDKSDSLFNNTKRYIPSPVCVCNKQNATLWHIYTCTVFMFME